MEGQRLGAHGLVAHGLVAHGLAAQGMAANCLGAQIDCDRYLKSETKCSVINLFHRLIIINLCVRISDKQAIFRRLALKYMNNFQSISVFTAR